jgi:NADP-dependent aldehyde dehydrogenase
MLHGGICDSYHKGLARVSKIDDVKLIAQSKAKSDSAKTQGEAVLVCTDAKNFRAHPELAEEIFGPFSVLISTQTISELEDIAENLEGQLTATVHGTPGDLKNAKQLLQILERKAGRLIINGFPTGVEVCPSMNHGGPYPATTDVRFTSVGTAALQRFVRPICYQNFPESLLPAVLQNENSLNILRLVNGKLSR